MRKNRAPQHDLTKPIRYVPSNDGAWDVVRVDREVAKLRADWEADRDRRLERLRADIQGAEEPDEQLLEELAAVEAEALDLADHHPFWRYFSGRTRYDIDDPELQSYLRHELEPEIWRLRTLSFEQRERANYLLRKDLIEEGYFYAFLHGVLGLEGVSDEAGGRLAKALAELPAKRLHKHEGALKEAIAGYAMGVVAEVGSAVVQASADLTSAEGKPSASPRGA
jgi:hypothetical protein